MIICIIGSGGREHSICKTISLSSKVNKIYCMPGNAGTQLLAENIELDINDFEKVLKFLKKVKVDLVIVGPEKPLVNGIVDYLNEIKNNNEQVVFISGHFNNFELMAMEIEKAGINLCAIYRPLNNPFLNIIMESIRKNYICKNQIKKGKGGTRDLLNLFKKNFSTALMIDQRVSEGEDIDLFNRSAKTTTIPAQLVKKYGCDIIPVYIERLKNYHFKLYFNKPIKFDDNLSIKEITLELNKILEKMILKNPDQWIWSHDRWK